MIQVAFSVELATLWPDREVPITEGPDTDWCIIVPGPGEEGERT